MAVRDGEPVFVWCSDASTVTRVKIYYSTAPGRSTKILDAEAPTPIDYREEIFAPGLLDVLGEGVGTNDLPDLIAISIIVEYVTEQEDQDGSFMAQYDLGYEELVNFPERTWIWPTGEKSNDPCGMPSGHRP